LKNVGASPRTPSKAYGPTDYDLFTSRNLTLDAFTAPVGPRLTTSDDRLPKTVPFIAVILNTDLVALNVLDTLSANLVFGQAVQLIEGSQVQEEVVLIMNSKATRAEPT
jgi:hypothetical protein